MPLPISLHLFSLVIAGGEAAIGGAGFTLALIGMLNVMTAVICSGHAQLWLRSGIDALAVPYLAVAGACVGAVVGIRARGRA